MREKTSHDPFRASDLFTNAHGVCGPKTHVLLSLKRLAKDVFSLARYFFRAMYASQEAAESFRVCMKSFACDNIR